MKYVELQMGIAGDNKRNKIFKENLQRFCDISGYHGGECEYECLVG
jgi:hypothetical protein